MYWLQETGKSRYSRSITPQYTESLILNHFYHFHISHKIEKGESEPLIPTIPQICHYQHKFVIIHSDIILLFYKKKSDSKEKKNLILSLITMKSKDFYKYYQVKVKWIGRNRYSYFGESLLLLGRWLWNFMINCMKLCGRARPCSSSSDRTGSFENLFSSVTQLCPTLWDPMDCSTPGLPVHHQFLEFTQTHVHWVGDAKQPSHLCYPLLLLPSIFPSIRVIRMSQSFWSGG